MRCGYELKDVGHSLSWGALHSFITNMGPESATARDLDPDLHRWSTTFTTNRILADIYDMLAMINANIVAAGSHKAAKKPKPYPRPGKKNSGDHYGKDAVPVDELRRLYAEKRKKRRKHG